MLLPVGGADAAQDLPQEAGYLLDTEMLESLGDGFVAGSVSVVQEIADGGFLIGGSFTSFDGDESVPDGLLRFTADGELDTAFNDALGEGVRGGEVTQIVAASGDHDGSYYLGGGFIRVSMVRSGGLVRIDSTGAVDTVFVEMLGGGAGPVGRVEALHELRGGDLLVGGSMSSWGGTASDGLVRLSAEGVRDLAYEAVRGSGFDGSVGTITEGPGGGVVVGGAFGAVDGDCRAMRAVLLDDTGALDHSFGEGCSDGQLDFGVLEIVPDGSGGFLLGGNFRQLGGRQTGALVRIDAEGVWDEAFTESLGVRLATVVVSILPTPAGFLVGGRLRDTGGLTMGDLVRVALDGTVDRAFGSELGGGLRGGSLGVVDVATWRDRILVLSDSTTVGSVPVSAGVVPLAVVGVQMPAADDRADQVGEALVVEPDAVVTSPVETTVGWSATGLPAGLEIDPSTGRISGTPTTVEMAEVQISATFGPGPVVPVVHGDPFTWAIIESAAIVGAPGPARAGVPFGYTFEVRGDPLPQVRLAGGDELPAGLEISPEGVLSGTPEVAGVYEFTLVASSGFGDDAELPVTLVVEKRLPDVTEAGSVIAADPVQITADGASTSTLTVTVQDVYGVPVGHGDADVVVTTDAGTISTTENHGDGTYSAVLTSTEQAAVATLRFTVDGTAAARTTTVEFAPGAPDLSETGTTIEGAPTRIEADGDSTSTVTVTVRDVHGNAVGATGAAVEIFTDVGELTGTQDLGDGTYSAVLTSTTVAQVATLGFTYDGVDAASTATVEFAAGVPDGSETGTTITADPVQITADGVSTSTVVVTTTDAHGNPLGVGGDDVVVTADAGTVSTTEDLGDGTYRAVLTAARQAGVATVGFTLNGAVAANTVVVELLPGAPELSETGSTIVAAPEQILADGASTSTVTVTVRDAQGNPTGAGGEAVTLTTDAGTVSGTEDHGDGTYTAELTSSSQAGVATVGFTMDGTVAANTVVVEFLPGAPDLSETGTTIEADPEQILADGVSTSTITVTVRDVFGNPVGRGGDDVVVSTDAGAVSTTADQGDGTYSAVLTASTQAGLATVGFTMGGTPAASTVVVELVAPATGDRGESAGEDEAVEVDVQVVDGAPEVSATDEPTGDLAASGSGIVAAGAIVAASLLTVGTDLLRRRRWSHR